MHWLATSLAPAVAKWAIIGLLGWLVKLIRAHVHVQRQIADRLDTQTPGGLADVVAAEHATREAVEKPKPSARSRAKPKTDGGSRG